MEQSPYSNNPEDVGLLGAWAEFLRKNNLDPTGSPVSTPNVIDLSTFKDRCLVEAQQEAFSIPDLGDRTQALSTSVAAGNVNLVAPAIQAYNRLNKWERKTTRIGRELVEALSAQQAFMSAYGVACEIADVSPEQGVHACTTLVAHGYNGPNDELLHLLPDDYVNRPAIRSEYIQQKLRARKYLEALATQGIDVTDPEGPYAALYESLLQVDKGADADMVRRNLVAAYADNSHLSLALSLAKKIATPIDRAQAFIHLCRYNANALNEAGDATREAQHAYDDQRTSTVWWGLILEFTTALSKHTDNPSSVESILAVLQTFNKAQGIVRYPLETLRARAELYKLSDYQATAERQHIIALLPVVDVTLPEAQQVLTDLVEADIARHQTVTPPGTEEDIPLAIWEVLGALSKDPVEPRHKPPQPSGTSLHPDDAREEILCHVAILLAKHNAPTTAHQLLAQIKDTKRRIRTKTVIGTMLPNQA